MTEHIVVTPNLRITVRRDEDAQSPRENGDYQITGFVNIDDPGRHWSQLPQLHDDPTGQIVEAHERLYGWKDRDYLEKGADLVIRWAKIFHGLVLVYGDGVGYHRGYWFCSPEELAKNWPDEEVGSQASLDRQLQTIREEHDQYMQWIRGEVSIVSAETRARWIRVDSTGTPIRSVEPNETFSWERTELQMGGCYLGDEYAAVTVALEYFDLIDATEEDRLALERLNEDRPNEWASRSRQHFIDTGKYLTVGEVTALNRFDEDEVTHQSPPGSAGVAPCCGVNLFDLPLRDRVTVNGFVTCTGVRRG